MKKIILLIVLIFSIINCTIPTFASYSSVNYSAYVENVDNKIRANWVSPNTSQGKYAIVLCKLTPNGELKENKILKSSGNEKLDTAAQNAVARSAPFYPFPKNATEDYVDLLLVFGNNTFNSSIIIRDKEELKTNKTDSYLDAYKQEVVRVLSNNIPQKKKFYGKTVEISLILDSDGTVKDVLLEKTSGDSQYDDEVIHIVKGLKFPEFPSYMNKDNLFLTYQIKCQKNIKQKNNSKSHTKYDEKSPVKETIWYANSGLLMAGIILDIIFKICLLHLL